MCDEELTFDLGWRWEIRHPRLLLSARYFLFLVFQSIPRLYIVACASSGSPASQASRGHNLPQLPIQAVYGKCDEREDGEQVKRMEERAAEGGV